jgi:hypothetical protein
VVLLVGLNNRQRGKLERPIKPKTCAPADLEAAMDYAGKPRDWEIVVVSSSARH